MSLNSGARAKRRISAALISTLVGLALIVAIAGAFLWADFNRGKMHEANDLAAYGASGPPCPVVTPAQLETNGPHLRHTFEFADTSLSYAFGGTDCAWIKNQGEKVAVCRFDAPGSLGVKVGAAPQLLFTPGIGKHAAIVRQGDKISCVMTAKEMG